MAINDTQLLSRIHELVGEEHTILDREGAGHAHEGDSKRLDELQKTLDQCWDLLRQRRAYREAGRDQDLAAARSEATVEGYEQ